MNLLALIRVNPNIAVFSRNHDDLLKACKARPNDTIPFLVKSAWTSAKDALEYLKRPLPIYFVPVGSSDGLIKYVATLTDVILHPPSSPSCEIQKLLECRVEACKRDPNELYGPDGKLTADTIYVISRCQELSDDEQIPFTRLRKLSDGKVLSADYHYGYAIVHEMPGLHHDQHLGSPQNEG